MTKTQKTNKEIRHELSQQFANSFRRDKLIEIAQGKYTRAQLNRKLNAAINKWFSFPEYSHYFDMMALNKKEAVRLTDLAIETMAARAREVSS